MMNPWTEWEKVPPALSRSELHGFMTSVEQAAHPRMEEAPGRIWYAVGMGALDWETAYA
jgi:hypothetical protein